MKKLIIFLILLLFPVALSAESYKYKFNEKILVPIISVSEHNIMYGDYKVYGQEDYLYFQMGMRYYIDKDMHITIKTEQRLLPNDNNQYSIDEEHPTLIIQFKFKYK